MAARDHSPFEADPARYARRIRKRIRWSDLAMNTRSVGQRLAWTVALVAGAAITLSKALDTAPGWLPAVLGFVVVVAQGADRLFSRAVDGARSMEVMRRSLSKEHRLFEAGVGPYADGDHRFETFVSRCESVIDTYDVESVTHLDTLQAQQ